MASRPWYEASYKTEAAFTLETSGSEPEKLSEKCNVCGSCHEPEACERCGTVLHVGQWATCKGNPSDHGFTKHYGFEPYIDEHILPNGREVGRNLYGELVSGTFIHSRSDRKAIMKANNIVSGGKVGHKGRSVEDHTAVAERIVREATDTWRKRNS
jgi:hypothetical protein